MLLSVSERRRRNSSHLGAGWGGVWMWRMVNRRVGKEEGGECGQRERGGRGFGRQGSRGNIG
jgi:hypothetical protein